MGRLLHHRRDHVLSLARTRGSEILLRAYARNVGDVGDLRDGLRPHDAVAQTQLGSAPPSTGSEVPGDWLSFALACWALPPQLALQDGEIERIVIECEDADLAALDFELAFERRLPTRPLPLMRSMALGALNSGSTVQTPLRIVQLNAAASPLDLVPLAQAGFGRHDPKRVTAEAQVESLPLGVLPGKEPVASVLHVWRIAPPPDELLDASRPSLVGTLGWALWLTRASGCKLLVLHAAALGDEAALRRLAHAVTARGGPAVLVMRSSQAGLAAPLYANLLQDYPLDRAVAELRQPGALALFAGGGREEAIRWWRDDEQLDAVASLSLKSRRTLGDYFGLAPSKGPGQPAPQRRPAAAARARPRHVNMTLWRGGGESAWSEIPQRGAPLPRGELVHLRVNIGALRQRLFTAGSAQLNEQAIHFAPNEQRTWIEFAVTGIDFEVVGDPVRSLELNRQGDSDPVYFGLRAQRSGAARLRLCLYHRQNLIQSFRFAVLVSDGQALPLDPEPAREQLAAALELTPAQRTALFAAKALTAARPLRYLQRLEYSLVGQAGQAMTRPERRLSLFFNEWQGVHVITLKGEQRFGVETIGDVDNHVEALRSLLRQTSTSSSATGEEYAFLQDGVANRGSEAQLQRSLARLAEQGWQLYEQLFPSVRQRQHIDTLLATPGVIHVAHALVEDVLPWAALYDRQIDAGAGVPVVSCTAALQAPRQEWQTMSCGQHADCPLHPQQQAQRGGGPIAPKHVVCPLHFWGFRHVIELPLQQVQGTDATAQVDQVQAGAQVQVAAAVHEGLRHTDAHVQALQALPSPVPMVVTKRARRNEVVDLLARADLDLIYFYCHARGGGADAPLDQRLEFKAEQDAAAGTVKAGEFEAVLWGHHPLVFINGCHSAGFSPRALSPFVRKFRGLEASGVIGTEVDVWEELAAHVATRFFTLFLAGNNAGDALREVRLELLAQHNPLGLVYTLHAPAQLMISHRAAL